MNNLAKVLVGVGVVGVTVAVAVAVKKKNERKYIEQPVDVAAEAVKIQHKDDTVIDKIKAAATKKAIRILAWVAIHQKEIESFSLLLGVVGGIFSIVNSLKEYAFGKKLHAKLNRIQQQLDTLTSIRYYNF